MPWNRNTGATGGASISITRDYGLEMIKAGEVTPDKGETVMEALKSFARVETEYGGGFVSSIEGLANIGGSERKDWFYYFNGTMAGVGAEDVVLRPGDSVWWDYHEWHGGDFAPAAVGAYPAPFTRGYQTDARASTVVFGDGMEAAAREVGAFLEKSGAGVEYSDRPSSFERGEGPSIVFLTAEQAQRTQCVGRLMTGDRGAFVALQEGKIVALDANGGRSPTVDPITCAVVGTASGMGDPAPVWFVLCSGPEDAGRAAELLTSERTGLKDKIGAVVESTGRLTRVPR